MNANKYNFKSQFLFNSKKLSFSRQEFSGAFGDIGTDLPLIVAMLLATDLNPSMVLSVFGLMQVFSGLYYGMPIPVQPLKAMATLVISQQILDSVLFASGLIIGLLMLLLNLVGLLNKLKEWIPVEVVKGLQFGLGLSLISLAVQQYIPKDGTSGLLLAGLVFILLVWLKDNKKIPGALLAIVLGLFYGLFFNVDIDKISFGFRFCEFNLDFLQPEILLKGFLLLTLPQLPLSIGNSIVATHQLGQEYYPERKDFTITKIANTYGAMNVVSPFLGGIPVCHGSGGFVGHYNFGGRTGGSVVVYGAFFLLIGLFFGKSFLEVSKFFPMPVLGVILLFEGLGMVFLLKSIFKNSKQIFVAIITGAMAFLLPYGFFVSLLAGTVLSLIVKKLR